MSGSDQVCKSIIDDPFEPGRGKVLLEARRSHTGGDGSDDERNRGQILDPCPTDPHPNLWGMRINLGTTHSL